MRFFSRFPSVEPSGWPGMAPIAETLLRQRGIDTPEKAEAFLNPSIERLPDVATLPGVLTAAERIAWAVKRDEAIVVYGDYDADGVTATAILTQTLRALGATRVRPYIPERSERGYGLHADTVRDMAASAGLLITVDLGITALDEVRLCKQLGLDIVVTDHHHPLDTLPETPWIVHAMLAKDSPFAVMCGAGIAWALASVLQKQPAAMETLDLAALGTVADLVPLTGVNRIIVAEGLKRMNAALRPGLLALLQLEKAADKPVTVSTLGYTIAPRINAGGRLATNVESVDMLLATDEQQAKQQAARLCQLNQQRIDQERAIADEVMRRVEREGMPHRALVLEGDWHPGIVGIVASRLVERYGVPAVLLCRDGEQQYIGSARSVAGVHLFKTLEGMSHLFIRFGGHAMAAGMTLLADNLEAFKQTFFQAMDDIDGDVFLPEMPYDIEQPPAAVDLALIEQIERMQPFGVGNPTPVFFARGVKLETMRAIGDGSHLKASLGQLSVLAFRMGHRREEMQQALDIAYQMERNEWNGRISAQITLRECAPAERTDWNETARQHAYGRLWSAVRRHMNEGEGAMDMPVFSCDEARAWVAQQARDPIGTLLLCAQHETRQTLVAWLGGMGALHRFRLCEGAPPDHPRAHGALVLAPEPGHRAYKRYARALWCDGVWEDGLARALGGIEQYAAEWPGWRQARAEAAAEALPDVEQMRDMWRWFRACSEKKQRYASTAELIHAMRGIATPVQLQTGIFALCDAGHIAFEGKGPVTLLTGGVNPSEQGFYALLSRWAAPNHGLSDGTLCASPP